MLKLKKLHKTSLYKPIIAIVLIIAIAICFFFILELALQTSNPLLVVEDSSMKIDIGSNNNFFPFTNQNPFDPTLNAGDLVFVQNVKPSDLNSDYPNSDLVVFHDPNISNGYLIIHRIVSVQEIDGKLYFQTKGDGNGDPWPTKPTIQECDPSPGGQGISQDLVIGKVVMRVPWVGSIPHYILNTSWGLPLIFAIIIIVFAILYLKPKVIKKRKIEVQKTTLKALQRSL